MASLHVKANHVGWVLFLAGLAVAAYGAALFYEPATTMRWSPAAGRLDVVRTWSLVVGVVALVVGVALMTHRAFAAPLREVAPLQASEAPTADPQTPASARRAF